MTLHIVGLGLWNKDDISVRGLAIVRRCRRVFLESYTSSMGCSVEELSNFYGKEVIPADRNLVENRAEEILEEAAESDVALLVIGDPLSATTHTDIIKRAEDRGISVNIVHNASVLTAVGETGLELYKFGKITSIPFPERSFRPETPFDVLKGNLSLGLHTLLLLDLRPSENRFMTVNQALAYLLEISHRREEPEILNSKTMCIGCARLGSDDSLIKYGTAENLIRIDFGKPPHCIIIPGKLHFMEEERLRRHS